MQLGTRESFDYFECENCGCLQIAEIPADLERHYPVEYFSFTLQNARPGAYGWLRGIRNRAALTGRGAIGRLLSVATRYAFAEIGAWLVEERIPTEARILDVGCGAGQLLCEMAAAGYRNLRGVDPFIARDLTYENGVSIDRKTIHDIDGRFDLVLFIHSLEHVPDPREALAAAARLLEPDGRCIVWSPTVPCWAWEHYREDWVQLDAPRHLLIPSPRAIGHMAEQAALELAKVRYNSGDLQFTGSELYRRDIPLMQGGTPFTRSEMREFRKRARKLNAEGRGDQAAFFLRKA
jgi:SAM-dependent methyltransferase